MIMNKNIYTKINEFIKNKKPIYLFDKVLYDSLFPFFIFFFLKLHGFGAIIFHIDFTIIAMSVSCSYVFLKSIIVLALLLPLFCKLFLKAIFQ